MTLMEALKTKKPIKRQKWSEWIMPDILALTLLRWGFDDVTAEDWIVKES